MSITGSFTLDGWPAVAIALGYLTVRLIIAYLDHKSSGRDK